MNYQFRLNDLQILGDYPPLTARLSVLADDGKFSWVHVDRSRLREVTEKIIDDLAICFWESRNAVAVAALERSEESAVMYELFMEAAHEVLQIQRDLWTAWASSDLALTPAVQGA